MKREYNRMRKKIVIELIRTFNMCPPLGEWESPNYFGLELDVGLIQTSGWCRKKSLQLCAVLNTTSTIFSCLSGGLALVYLIEWTAHGKAVVVSPITYT